MRILIIVFSVLFSVGLVLGSMVPVTAQSTGFVETFAIGQPTSPKVFTSPRWILLPGNNDGLTTNPDGHVEIPAGHGSHCEPPIGNPDPNNNNHFLKNSTEVDRQTYNTSVAPQNIYGCNDHIMTTAFGGTSEVGFMSRYTMDWTNRTVNFQFEVNPYSSGRAEWWNLYIAPPEDFTLNTNVFSRNAVIVDFNADVPGITQIVDYRAVRADPNNAQSVHQRFWQGYCESTNDPACSDPRTRRTFKISINNTHIAFNIVKPDGSLYNYVAQFPQPLNFNVALFEMSHWSYNPTKQEFFHGGWIQGQPFSINTYHWSNFQFDGPAASWKTGYPLPNTLIDTTWRGSNPSQVVHFNVGSGALRNPRLWGSITAGGVDSQGDPKHSPVRLDTKDTTHWAQFSLNGGPWMDMPGIRDQGAPFVDAFGTDTNETSMTFIQNVPLNLVHNGDNTIQFRQVDSIGFTVDYAELQVDPNNDLPPANPGGIIPPTSTPGATNTASPIPSPTVSPTATVTLTPTVEPTATPLPDGEITPTPTATVAPTAVPEATPTVEPTPIPICEVIVRINGVEQVIRKPFDFCQGI